MAIVLNADHRNCDHICVAMRVSLNQNQLTVANSLECIFLELMRTFSIYLINYLHTPHNVYTTANLSKCIILKN